MKVKLSVVVRSCVKTKVALLASHDPDELVRLGFRFTNSWTVWQSRQRYVCYTEQTENVFIDYFTLVVVGR